MFVSDDFLFGIAMDANHFDIPAIKTLLLEYGNTEEEVAKKFLIKDKLSYSEKKVN